MFISSQQATRREQLFTQHGIFADRSPATGTARNTNFDLHASSGTGYCGRTRRLEAELALADQEYRVGHRSGVERRTKVATYQIQDEGFHWQGVDG